MAIRRHPASAGVCPDAGDDGGRLHGLSIRFPAVIGQLPPLKKDGVDGIAVQTAWYQKTDTSTHIFPDPTIYDDADRCQHAPPHRGGTP